MVMYESLLLSEAAWGLPPEFYSCWKARGLYNPLQFVLRLRPDIHRALNDLPTGWIKSKEVSEEQLSAFSTYLHETIHWWQHVGSTSGFVLSLIYPAQSHFNHNYLIQILSELGPIKSIRDYNLLNAKPQAEESRIDRTINVVMNNWHDIEFYRWLVIDPKNVKGKIGSPYFECVGHSYRMALTAVLWLLSSTVDPNQEIFPDPQKWEERAERLRTARGQGFYYGSPIALPPIGAKEIFEGQARFSQLQYLYMSSGKAISWEAFEKAGMFSSLYVDAFILFLEITGLVRPTEFDDPTIGLFLLVCDVSINPTVGLIEDVVEFELLIDEHDPGMRFLRLCMEIRESPDKFRSLIADYSADEYWKTTDLLCSSAGFAKPRDVLENIASWPERHQSIKMLLEEDRTFDFSDGNLPVRVFLARFVTFQIDKLSYPEFFCWPGMRMTEGVRGEADANTALALFEEHRALFLDKEDGDIYPRTFLDRDERIVQETFNEFYRWVAVYELTRQWLVEPGEFTFNFSWLTSKYSQNELKEWVSSSFEVAYGISIEDFKVVPTMQ